MTVVRDGVYDVQGFGLRVRVIVAHQLPLQAHNAMLHLLSAREELLRYGRENYRPQSPETSTLLYELFKTYHEDATMPDKLKVFVRESIDKLLASLPPEELRKHLSVKERLQDLSAEEVLRELSPETLAAIARQLKTNGHSSKPQ